MNLDVDIIGDKKVLTDLLGLSERAKDARPALRQVRDVMESGIKHQFASQGSYFGTPWAPLKPTTLAKKAQKGEDLRTLRATGALEASLSGGKGKRRGVTRTSARTGTSIFYGRFAQSGTKRQPARKIVGMSKADKLRAMEMLETYVIHGRVIPG